MQESFFSIDPNQAYPYNQNLRQRALISKLESQFNLTYARNLGDLVHFQSSHLVPVQRWFPYREGFSTKLVEMFLKQFITKGNVLDPFCGSGTTLVASRLNNINSFGIDINPISVLISRVKNAAYSSTEIEMIRDHYQQLLNTRRNEIIYESNFELAEKIFNADILHALLQIKQLIVAVDDSKIRDLLLLNWLAIIEEVSNIKKEGNGIKYKNRKRTSTGYIEIPKGDWELKRFPEDKHRYVFEKYLYHLNTILHDLQISYGSVNCLPKVFHGDAIDFDKKIENIFQMSFFSPPYCNCFDYFEIHKVELWLGDFITTKEELKNLRIKGFRSNTNANLDKAVNYTNSTLDDLIKLFDDHRLWHKKIPLVVQGYFDDMHSLLLKLFNRTEKNGIVAVVIGSSAYSGVIIPTDLIIADIAQEIGFNVKNIYITRHLTTSSQQKKHLEKLRDYLRESIVVLERL